MMPLTMAGTGEVNVIKRIGGKEKTRKFLENLGFVTGGILGTAGRQHDGSGSLLLPCI